MKFHPDKCEVIRVGRKCQPIPHDYILHGQTLQLVDTSKYLGVTLSSDLSWHCHIDKITGKANSTLAFLRRNLQVNSPKIKISRPRLLWPILTTVGICRYSLGSLLHQLGWNSLQSRRKAMRLCRLYKLHHGLVAADGMPQLIPMRRASRHLNSNVYEVPCHEQKYPRTLSEKINRMLH